MRILMMIYYVSVEVFQKYHHIHSLFCFVRTVSLFMLTYLLSMLATVTLLIVGFY